MINYIIEIQYDGSKYYGLQKLKDKPTIQGEIETVLAKLDKQPVKLLCSGRTDKGVHAKMQVCTFTLHKDIDPYRLRYYIDRQTSKYIYISKCSYLTQTNFHPRFSVKSKVYTYIINEGPYDPIQEDYAYNYNKALDIDSMIDASETFIGTHDYRAYVTGPQKTCITTIDKIDIKRSSNLIYITFQGKCFYTYMVRNLVKALLLVGSKTITKEHLAIMLKERKKIIEFSPAPPNGLYLEKILY